MTEEPVGIGRGLCSLSPTTCDPRFLWWWMHSQIPRLSALGTGSTYLAVTTEDVGSLPFPLTDLEEQQRIARYLDDQVSFHRALLKSRRREIEVADRRLRSRIVEAVFGQKQALEVSPLKRLVSRPIGGVWGREPSGGSFDKLCVRVADFDRLLLRGGSAAATVRHVSPSECNRRQLASSDILIEKSGGGDQRPVGVAVNFDGVQGSVFSNFVAAVRVNDDVSARYIVLLLSAMYETGLTGKYVKQTTGIQNLDVSALMSHPVPVPERSVQYSISREVDAELEALRSLKSCTGRQFDLLTAREHQIIEAAVTGKIDVGTARRVTA